MHKHVQHFLAKNQEKNEFKKQIHKKLSVLLET